MDFEARGYITVGVGGNVIAALPLMCGKARLTEAGALETLTRGYASRELEHSPAMRKGSGRKGEAFPHIGRQSRGACLP